MDQNKKKKRDQTRSRRNSKLGLDALMNCESKAKDLEREEIKQMIQEILLQGNTQVTAASLVEPKVIQERFSYKYLKDFQVTLLALKGAYDAMLNTQGLFQADKCNDTFALKSIATLAKSVKKIQDLFDECKGVQVKLLKYPAPCENCSCYPRSQV